MHDQSVVSLVCTYTTVSNKDKKYTDVRLYRYYGFCRFFCALERSTIFRKRRPSANWSIFVITLPCNNVIHIKIYGTAFRRRLAISYKVIQVRFLLNFPNLDFKNSSFEFLSSYIFSPQFYNSCHHCHQFKVAWYSVRLKFVMH